MTIYTPMSMDQAERALDRLEWELMPRRDWKAYGFGHREMAEPDGTYYHVHPVDGQYVGRFHGDKADTTAIEVLGWFLTEDAAKSACEYHSRRRTA
jgi:hypothetical protein